MSGSLLATAIIVLALAIYCAWVLKRIIARIRDKNQCPGCGSGCSFNCSGNKDGKTL